MSGYNTGFTFGAGGATSLNATQIGFGSGTNTLTGAATLTYNSVSGVLTSSLGDAVINGITMGRGGSNVGTNLAFGVSALGANTAGASNIGIGSAALAANQIGSRNVGIGFLAINSGTNVSDNTAVGYTALQNVTGLQNTAVGSQTLAVATGAGNNVAVGFKASNAITTGNNNTTLGYQAGLVATSGSTNVFLGANSGSQVSTGSNNVIIGGYNGFAVPISQSNNNKIVLSDGQGNVALYFDGLTKSMFLQGPVFDGTSSAGTLGQVLTSGGAGTTPTWTTVAGSSLTLANSVTSASYYIPFSSVATGSVTTEYTNTSLFYNPGAAILSAPSYVGTGTGTGIQLSSSNAGAGNNILSQNNSNTANAFASFSVSAGGSAASFAKNSPSFNAAPTTFAQVNSATYINAGTSQLNFLATGGINLTYSNNTKAITIDNNGAILLNATPTVAGSAGTNGQVLTSQGPGVPAIWTTVSGGGAVASFSAGTTGFTPNTATTGAITLAGILSIANGGTNSNATATAGGVGYGTGSAHAYTAAGTTGQVLISQGAAAPVWAALSSSTVTTFAGGTTGLTPASPTSGAITLGGTLVIANGGTNSTATPTLGAVAVGNGSGYAFSAVGTAGQVLVSNGAAVPSWQTVSALTLANSAAAVAQYLTFSSVATGAVATEYTNAGLTYTPAINTVTAGAYQATGTGNSLFSSVSNSGGVQSVTITNTAATANSASAIYAYAGAGSGAVLSANSSAFNASPTTFFQKNSGVQLYTNVASGSLSLGSSNATGGVINLTYGSGASAYTISNTGEFLVGSTPTVAGSAGTAGQVLTSGGPGAPLTWAAPSATVTIPNTLIPFGSATNTLTTVANFNFNSTTNRLSIGNASSGGASLALRFFGQSTNATYTGTNNTCAGSGGMPNLSSGSDNTSVGYNALNGTTTASSNTAVGSNAMSVMTTGSANTAVGAGAGTSIGNTSANNTFVGVNAGTGFVGAVSTGNTFIGQNAGVAITSGSYNTVIGSINGSNGSNGVFLGDGQNHIVASWAGLTGNMTNVGSINASSFTTSGNITIFSGSGGQLLVGTSNSTPIIGFSQPRIAVVGTTTDGLTVISAPGNNTVNIAKNAGNTNGAGLASGSVFAAFVGTGTVSNTTYGSITVNGTGTTYGTTSDARFKTNVVSIANGIDSVKALNPVNFDWIDSEEKGQGFIAQDTIDIVPTAVIYDEKHDHYSMDYSRIVPVLTAAIKEQQAIIEALVARLDKAGL